MDIKSPADIENSGTCNDDGGDDDDDGLLSSLSSSSSSFEGDDDDDDGGGDDNIVMGLTSGMVTVRTGSSFDRTLHDSNTHGDMDNPLVR
jgi:hypothetical protein